MVRPPRWDSLGRPPPAQADRQPGENARSDFPRPLPDGATQKSVCAAHMRDINMLLEAEDEATRLRLSCCFAASLTKGSDKPRACRRGSVLKEEEVKEEKIQRQLLLAAVQTEATVIWSGKCSVHSLGIPRTSRI